MPVLTNCSSPCSSQNSTHFSADIVLTPVSITFPPALLYNSSIFKSITNSTTESLTSSFWLSDPYQSETKYFDIDELNALSIEADKSELFIIHINAVSLVRRFSKIKTLIAILKNGPSIIFVSEARLSNEKHVLKTQLHKVELDGYHKPSFCNSQLTCDNTDPSEIFFTLLL